MTARDVLPVAEIITEAKRILAESPDQVKREAKMVGDYYDAVWTSAMWMAVASMQSRQQSKRGKREGR